jgi:hypothetical protein
MIEEIDSDENSNSRYTHNMTFNYDGAEEKDDPIDTHREENSSSSSSSCSSSSCRAPGHNAAKGGLGAKLFSCTGELR